MLVVDPHFAYAPLDMAESVVASALSVSIKKSQVDSKIGGANSVPAIFYWRRVDES